MPPQHIFVSNYKNYSEITDTKKFSNIFLSGIIAGSSIGYFNEFIKKINLNINGRQPDIPQSPFNNNDNQQPTFLKQYASYKVNNSTCEEWRNELNKCYSVTKNCDHLKVVELQKELEKCH